jgi:hypothetical protein
VRRIAVAAGAGVHADARALGRCETRKREVVQLDEALQQMPGGIELHREPAFGEVDLHLVRAFVETAPHFGLVLAQKIVYERLARVAGDRCGRIHEAQRGRRDDRLLQWHVGIAACVIEEAIGITAVVKRTFCEARHAARVARGERDPETVGRGVRAAFDAVGPEVVILALLAVADDRRAGRFEALYGVANRGVVERLQRRVVAIEARQRFDELERSRDAADRFRGDGHEGTLHDIVVAGDAALRRHAREQSRPLRCKYCSIAPHRLYGT